MTLHIQSFTKSDCDITLDSMFRDRKRVFVDILKWDVPVLKGWEIDQFDDESAQYFIIADPETRKHWGSMRVLRTDRPHILGDLFPSLCAQELPAGPEYRELTRLCLSPDLRARERLRVRNQLFTALVEYALMSNIKGYTGVASMNWYTQLLALGWRCSPLGLPQNINGELLAAVLAHIDSGTINAFRNAGTYDSGAITYSDLTLPPMQRAA